MTYMQKLGELETKYENLKYAYTILLNAIEVTCGEDEQQNINDLVELATGKGIKIHNEYISKNYIRKKMEAIQRQLEYEAKQVEDFTDFNPMIPVLMTERDTLSNLLGEEDE